MVMFFSYVSLPDGQFLAGFVQDYYVNVPSVMENPPLMGFPARNTGYIGFSNLPHAIFRATKHQSRKFSPSISWRSYIHENPQCIDDVSRCSTQQEAQTFHFFMETSHEHRLHAAPSEAGRLLQDLRWKAGRRNGGFHGSSCFQLPGVSCQFSSKKIWWVSVKKK